MRLSPSPLLVEALAVPLLGMAVSAPSVAQGFVYDSFSSTAGLSLNGDASVVQTLDGEVLRLARSERIQAGTVFTESPVPIGRFSCAFEFRITQPAGISDCRGVPGGDGLVFVAQTQGPDAVGIAGQGMGYESISPSAGIEFDLWCNSAYRDPSSNHVAVVVDGVADHNRLSTPVIDVTPDFDDAQRWFAWVDYDGATVELRLSQNGAKPATPNMEYSGRGLDDVLGASTAYVGFTAATWNSSANFDLLRWEYADLGSILVLEPLSPGLAGQVNFTELRHAQPGARSFLTGGLQQGATPVPGCANLALDIASARLVGPGIASSGGVVTWSLPVSAALSGYTVLIQAYEPATCRLSNHVSQSLG